MWSHIQESLLGTKPSQARTVFIFKLIFLENALFAKLTVLRNNCHVVSEIIASEAKELSATGLTFASQYFPMST